MPEMDKNAGVPSIRQITPTGREFGLFCGVIGIEVTKKIIQAKLRISAVTGFRLGQAEFALFYPLYSEYIYFST